MFCELCLDRYGDAYSSYHEIYVTQHDVLRDLALHLSNCVDVNERKRFLMPRRVTKLPRDWGRNTDRPFNAQIVSVHTGINDYLFLIALH